MSSTTKKSLPWWQSDDYSLDYGAPERIENEAGPKGMALVRVWPDGRTDKGWGMQPPPDELDGFMPRYMRGEFNPRRILYGYDKGKWAFAFVMRSLKLVCIDIDGKNGGLEHAKRLGALTPTMAETSKSGDGYHLFYSVDEDWNDDNGFGKLSDRIGIEQGVDIRATGCVYHHPQQRWNLRDIAPLPAHLYDQLTARTQMVQASNERISKVLNSDDQMEILMMQAELEAELAKPIPAGKRNQTLFAIGSQMQTAKVDGWEAKLSDRGHRLGLDTAEIDKLVGNIKRYVP